ncbi:polyketide synthase [Purpureocillium lavendulum]|uniref:Polyketide synthase n=1 Tax=Purpureocillium lavendulum TaxID=1247861 RepID=A0AB34FWF6_9HYPO|nr:polyketide synthase [Purpureocillium lavendulum]
MADTQSRSLAGPAVLLFGPLALSFDATLLTKLRTTIVGNPQHAWVQNTLGQLPGLWNTITAALPELEAGSGPGKLSDLAESFATDRQLDTPYPLPNTLLIPLVVIAHLTQYSQFTEQTNSELDARVDPFEGNTSQETLGFCTGLLSAFAVTSASSRQEFEKYGAVAIRLGMLIGMVVDAQDSTSPTKSLAVAWSSEKDREALQAIIDGFPEAYVSVEYDENRVTVTSPQSDIQKLHQRLKTAGFVSPEIGLYGRFHAKCHQGIIPALFQLCDANAQLQFKDASKIRLPTRSNTTGQLLTQGPLHRHALESILTEPPKWHEAMTTLRKTKLSDKDTLIISFGPERCVPPTHMLHVNGQVIHLADNGPASQHRGISENDIAVIGMSCKVAGANNLEEFWDLLCAGKSQHKEVPKERMSFETAFRDVDPKRKWFANLVDSPDKFDHKFFKKSPRESATMDPQQRLLLQIAYQAVEQSGYFQAEGQDKRIGCYIGLCATDYENNIACHPANAFSATGNLQGFVAGKVSHHFGWTGPGLTIDTACSSSAVAVHQACRAIINGECTAALAGGTHVMTSPLWFQNLAGASFLSTTGQCKPFDAKADGYCRGEGVGAVFLKRLSAAVADGDQILGVVAATGVQQNQNCTPIFVPNAPSLSDLFRVVTKSARLEPSQVSVIEAHGTGTAVGDPAEYDSIRQVFGGPVRSRHLMLSSVKGLVGHVECTSGIVSMIKVLLMINKGMVPPQASFTTMNPAIGASPTDRISIPTSLRPWEADFRAALVNNYGASGSNASMLLTEAPKSAKNASSKAVQETRSLKHPFWLCGLDDQSLRRYSQALAEYLDSHRDSASENLSIGNIAFNLARQSNRGLDRGLIFTVQSLSELQEKLKQYLAGNALAASVPKPQQRPVVLCFGGQISTFVGLDRYLYENVGLLRKHLDNVDAAARSLGAGSIFPSIFQRTPIESIVKLQTVLFAMQYACARSWIDCGLKPSAVVGHSFGELTSLCIAQALSLDDALRMIINRATTIQNAWGSEKGAMMAVEAELRDLQKLLSESEATAKGVGIACYNGPKSFTLAGPDASIDAVADAMNKMPNSIPIRAKKLNVTNAFHSSLVQPLLERLEDGARGLTFREPKIPIERATETSWEGQFSPTFVAEHLRQPVFFNHAVQRLSKRYPTAVFLEAGSSSTITTMASRALGNPSTNHFQAININSDNSWNSLVDSTAGLWRAGVPVHFWDHQSTHAAKHTPLLLPPYQFDGTSHWLELKAPTRLALESTETKADTKAPETLLQFQGYTDKDNRIAKFQINTAIPEYEKYVKGHIIAKTAPICPSIVQLDLVIQAARTLHDPVSSSLEPQIHLVENLSPLCVNHGRQVFIEIEREMQLSGFRVFSTDGTQGGDQMVHTTGKIDFCATEDVSLRLEFARLERFMGHKRYLQMMSSPDVDEMLSHRNVYNIFSDIVEYSEEYRGLQKLVSQGNQSAGCVTRLVTHNKPGVEDAFFTEAVCQVGGIYVNCMTGRDPGDMFLANGIERWIRRPETQQPDTLHVLATHHQPSDKSFMTDVFVYNPEDGALIEAILGVSFVKVARSTMQRLLSRLSPGISSKSTTSQPVEREEPKVSQTSQAPQALQPSKLPQAPQASLAPKAPGIDVVPKVKEILADLSGLELHEIKNDSGLADLGIDSLMGMEMAHEIESAFKVTLPQDELMEIIDMPGLIRCVQKAVGSPVDAEPELEYEEPDARDSSDSRSVSSSDHQTAITTPQEDTDAEFGGELKLPFETVMDAFNQMKALTDDRIAEYGQTKYIEQAMPLQTKMCCLLTLEAFEELGIPLRSAKAGEKFPRLSHPKEHSRLVQYLYQMLDRETQLITVDDECITRTAVPYPTSSSRDVYEDLLQRFPDQDTANKLTFYTGSNLAEVLRGKTDGIKLVFGTAEGRELVSGLYGEWPLNRLFYKQMEDFLSRLGSSLSAHADGPLKILEMGAGTGGTTRWLVPLLATLNLPVEYTFTDLAPSFVALARKKFAKSYPFMKFRTHDIEKAPVADLVGSQHIVIASNAVHATHSIRESTGNIRKLLRPDGLLMMLEMTGTMYWVDMIFGLFEGWWFFDDGRTHAVANEKRWESDLQSVGYGHVDWTDGQRPENSVEKLIIAMASGPRCERTQIPHGPVSRPADLVERQATVDSYVRRYTEGFAKGLGSEFNAGGSAAEALSVVVTGATGSLGSHIVADLARRPDVSHVLCLNRPSKLDARRRQLDSFEKKGIILSDDCLKKLTVWETDLSKPLLGLPRGDYEALLQSTLIIHNAWLMNAKWPIKRFEPQLQIMRNLLDLALAASDETQAKVNFLFVSSIATVGHWPLHTGNPNVPEERMAIESVLPTGYGDAKYICERMLDETLHRYPERFRAMTVRPGQVAGSSKSGYWNTMEHLSFLVKSSQTLNALPQLGGLLSWTPVDTVAGTIVDLVTLADDRDPYPIYHIDNPIRQLWQDMLPVLADALGIPGDGQVELEEWVQRVKNHPRKGVEGPDGDNPALLLVDFLESNFVRMSCGGLLLGTTKAREHSGTLASCGPVEEELTRLFVQSWKDKGFLKF